MKKMTILSDVRLRPMDIFRAWKSVNLTDRCVMRSDAVNVESTYDGRIAEIANCCDFAEKNRATSTLAILILRVVNKDAVSLENLANLNVFMDNDKFIHFLFFLTSCIID